MEEKNKREKVENTRTKKSGKSWRTRNRTELAVDLFVLIVIWLFLLTYFKPELKNSSIGNFIPPCSFNILFVSSSLKTFLRSLLSMPAIIKPTIRIITAAIRFINRFDDDILKKSFKAMK